MVRLIFTLAITVLASAGLQQGWDEDTHGREAVPDYDRVFAQDVVNRLDIDVDPAEWEKLMADMADMAGTFGGIGGFGGMGGDGGFGGGNNQPAPNDAAAACTNRVEGDMCVVGNPPSTGRCTQVPTGDGLACFPLGGMLGQPGPGPGQPGMGQPGQQPGGGQRGADPQGPGGRDDVELLPRNPIYIPVTVRFEGIAFQHVGLRLKGNSTLLNSWRSGVDKLPMRLNFDEFENQYPEIGDQTFFGFPNLNLTNNSQDTSFMRAKVIGDLFREAGVPTARTAFVRVYMNRGQGPIYLGLYTLVEVPDEPMLETFFGSGDGNLYKPAGTGARWLNFDAESFPKKTNAEDEDWTDVEDAIAALNAPRTDPATWRRRLGARFDVNVFLRWLALNTVVGNTDTYGGFSPHNYYVYGSPRHRDRLFFIPWDHDLGLRTGIGGPTTSVGPTTIDVFHRNINSSWPLIRYLLDDPVYLEAYRQHLQSVLVTVFEPAGLIDRLRREHALVGPYVVGLEGEQPGHTFLNNPADFEQALFGSNGLAPYIHTRYDAAVRALSEVQ